MREDVLVAVGVLEAVTLLDGVGEFCGDGDLLGVFIGSGDGVFVVLSSPWT